MHLGARRPGCTSVQVHGDPNAPHQGAGAARAPCVTLMGAEAAFGAEVVVPVSYTHLTLPTILLV